MIAEIISRLQDERVIETRTRDGDGKIVYSLSHDILVVKVRSWYDDREVQRRRAQDTVERGVLENANSGALLDEVQVALVRQCAPADTLSPDAKRLLEESSAKLDTTRLDKKRHERRMWWLVRGIWAVTFAAFVIISIFYRAEHVALSDYDRLADLRLLDDYINRADKLWPARQGRVSELRVWLNEVAPLVRRLPDHEAALRRIPVDVLFINASEHFEEDRRQNRLLDEHIEKIVSTYQFRNEELRYSRRVSMEEITENDFNLNISRYISTAVAEEEIDLGAVNADLVSLEKDIATATEKHNAFLNELGLPLLPSVDRRPSRD